MLTPEYRRKLGYLFSALEDTMEGLRKIIKLVKETKLDDTKDRIKNNFREMCEAFPASTDSPASEGIEHKPHKFKKGDKVSIISLHGVIYTVLALDELRVCLRDSIGNIGHDLIANLELVEPAPEEHVFEGVRFSDWNIAHGTELSHKMKENYNIKHFAGDGNTYIVTLRKETKPNAEKDM